MKATNIQQKLFLHIVSDEKFHPFEQYVRSPPHWADFLHIVQKSNYNFN